MCAVVECTASAAGVSLVLWLSSTLLPPPEVGVALLLLAVAGLHTLLYMRPQAHKVLLTDQQKRLLGIPDNGSCGHMLSCDLWALAGPLVQCHVTIT